MSDVPTLEVRLTSTDHVRRSVRLSFAQAMLGAVYGASTGGMFLIGYAMALGADNVQIGLMSTFPMLCVFAQLVSALLVERGLSRRRITLAAALANVLGWGLIILIPYVAGNWPSRMQVRLLIGIITLVTFFAHISGNARGSWIGDLIPERVRGWFFGRLAMYGGIIAALFAVLEGAFLDFIKSHGLAAFSVLFGFGMIFGLANAMLFRPQLDVPIQRHAEGARFRDLVLGAFRNRPLMATMGFMLVFSLQMVAAPFYFTYLLRDLHAPYVGVGIINAMVSLTAIACAPFWGRVIGRVGCRPVLIFSSTVVGVLPFLWVFVTSPARAYAIIGPANALAGLAWSGVNVALSTLIYKVTPSQGRSVQLAINAIIVTVFAAPMPYLGGHLPDWLNAIGLGGDLRWTFYCAGAFCLLAALTGRTIREESAGTVRDLLACLRNMLLGAPRSPAN